MSLEQWQQRENELPKHPRLSWSDHKTRRWDDQCIRRIFLKGQPPINGKPMSRLIFLQCQFYWVMTCSTILSMPTEENLYSTLPGTISPSWLLFNPIVFSLSPKHPTTGLPQVTPYLENCTVSLPHGEGYSSSLGWSTTALTLTPFL